MHIITAVLRLFFLCAAAAVQLQRKGTLLPESRLAGQKSLEKVEKKQRAGERIEMARSCLLGLGSESRETEAALLAALPSRSWT